MKATYTHVAYIGTTREFNQIVEAFTSEEQAHTWFTDNFGDFEWEDNEACVGIYSLESAIYSENFDNTIDYVEVFSLSEELAAQLGMKAGWYYITSEEDMTADYTELSRKELAAILSK